MCCLMEEFDATAFQSISFMGFISDFLVTVRLRQVVQDTILWLDPTDERKEKAWQSLILFFHLLWIRI